MGYTCTLESLLIFNKRHDLERNEDSEALQYFTGFYVAVFTIPLLCTIAIILQFGQLRTITSLAYQTALCGLIVGGLIFLFEARKISIETLRYFAKPTPIFSVNVTKVKKSLLIGILVFIVFSVLNEYQYRRHWIIFSETLFLFIIIAVQNKLKIKYCL
ncbi:hypothetical protein D1BOALGB6SA_3465 [Olavius sp. associated proteobacterium Delta 1]|nr:hypothetical protein D1BOALGB6SA_3465 [Olavius sp. associated proteobacterium Delta 1]